MSEEDFKERQRKYKERKYKEEQRKYNLALDKLKAKLTKEYNLEGHPKLELLWRKAYELGHANGLHDIDYYFGELVELIL